MCLYHCIYICCWQSVFITDKPVLLFSAMRHDSVLCPYLYSFNETTVGYVSNSVFVHLEHGVNTQLFSENVNIMLHIGASVPTKDWHLVQKKQQLHSNWQTCIPTGSAYGGMQWPRLICHILRCMWLPLGNEVIHDLMQLTLRWYQVQLYQ